MATGNPTTEAQQAYDNFWPKVTDGIMDLSEPILTFRALRNQKYVHCWS